MLVERNGRRRHGHEIVPTFYNAHSLLELSGTRISNALRYLEGLPRLSWLELNGTKVSDDGLQSLKRVGPINSLGLGDASIPVGRG